MGMVWTKRRSVDMANRDTEGGKDTKGCGDHMEHNTASGPKSMSQSANVRRTSPQEDLSRSN
jgi:hypothetical protein